MASTIFFAGCTEGDYGIKPEDPQQWGPDEPVTIQGSVTAAPVADINLGNVEAEKVSVATCTYEEVEGAASCEYRVVVTAAERSVTYETDSEMKVAVEDLQNQVTGAFGFAVQKRELSVVCMMSAVFGKQAYVFKSEPVTLNVTPYSTSPVVLYCADPADWTEANLYGWNTTGMDFGGWPGIKTTEYVKIGGTKWFYWNLGTELSGVAAGGIIFSGATGQTVDMTGLTLDGSMFFTLTMDGGKYNYTQTAPEKIKITYTNPNNWESVNLYGWGAWSAGDWPGVPMVKNADGVWEYEISYAEYFGEEGQMLIFNGGGSQTADLGPFVIDKDLEFNDENDQ